jgi:hypothetical protein
MKRGLFLFVTAVLCVAGQAAAQQMPPQPGGAPMPPGPVPQIVAFDNEGCWGITSTSLPRRPIWASGAIASPPW